jgi:hypothetical protein
MLKVADDQLVPFFPLGCHDHGVQSDGSAAENGNGIRAAPKELSERLTSLCSSGARHSTAEASCLEELRTHISRHGHPDMGVVLSCFGGSFQYTVQGGSMTTSLQIDQPIGQWKLSPHVS